MFFGCLLRRGKEALSTSPDFLFPWPRISLNKGMQYNSEYCDVQEIWERLSLLTLKKKKSLGLNIPCCWRSVCLPGFWSCGSHLTITWGSKSTNAGGQNRKMQRTWVFVLVQQMNQSIWSCSIFTFLLCEIINVSHCSRHFQSVFCSLADKSIQIGAYELVPSVIRLFLH